MAFIKIIPPGKASGETAEVYKQMARVTGQSMVPKIVQIFSLRPGSMRRMIRLWELSMWIGQAPRQNREMVAAAVSRSNRCYYWIDAHEANLQAAGGQATRVARLMDGTAGNITALERELITLVRKSVEQPMRLIPSDLDPVRDFVGDDALDYTLIIGGFHFVNRIADLLDVPQEVLPGPLPRYEFLRRIMVRLAGILMSRMDLNNRDYGVTYATALEKLQPFFDNENGYKLERKLAPLKPRPKLVEAFLLLLEERKTRSSLDQTVLVKIHQMVERALPENIDEAEGFHPIPKDPIEAFAFMGTRYAYRSTTDMIDALRQEGYDDLGILDLSIAIADANMWARFYRLLDLEAGLFYLT